MCDHVAVILRTDRLDIEPVSEAYRAALVDMFMEPSFMVFSGGESHTVESANEQYDEMKEIYGEVSFGKRPIVVRSTGEVVGYAGVGVFEFEGRRWYEFGWRLIESARGNGYATEAARAVVEHAAEVWSGDILVIMGPTNERSANVARKIGSVFWKQADFEDAMIDVYRLTVPG
jgi:RimJ/RimL family protein N-acetyltransferase